MNCQYLKEVYAVHTFSISKTNENTFLYTHKDYSGCISDFEKALELTKDEDLINFLKFLLKNMSTYSLTP